MKSRIPVFMARTDRVRLLDSTICRRLGEICGLMHKKDGKLLRQNGRKKEQMHKISHSSEPSCPRECPGKRIRGVTVMGGVPWNSWRLP